MTARASVLPAALLRAGLLAAVMAIVAGIFGMHVMTADHYSHAAHAGAAVAAGDAAVGHAPAGHTAAEHAAVDHSAGHTAVEHSDAGHAAVLADAVGAAGAAFTASESCSAGCPDVREGGASCTPGQDRIARGRPAPGQPHRASGPGVRRSRNHRLLLRPA